MSYFSYFWGSEELSVEEKLKNENENLKKLNNTLVNDYNSLKIKNQNLNTTIENNSSFNEILNNDNNEKNKTISHLQLKLIEYEKKFVEQKNELELLNKEVEQMFYQTKTLTCENRLLKNSNKKMLNKSIQTDSNKINKLSQIDFSKFHFKED
jgi:hypothetical protein